MKKTSFHEGTMNEGLKILKETERLIAEAEKSMEKLKSLHLPRIQGEINSVLDRTDALRRKLLHEEHDMLRLLAQLSVKIGKDEYPIGKQIYSLRPPYVSVYKNKKSSGESFEYWDFIEKSGHWTYEFLEAMATAIAEAVDLLPAEQVSLTEDIDKLVRLGEAFAKLSK